MRVLALLAWMLIITYWSDQPSLPIDQREIAELLFGLQHKLAHLVAFGGLGLLAWWVLHGWPRAALLAVLATCLFAAVDEWHQSFVPGRKPGVDDWLFDTFSAGLAIYAWPRLTRVSRSPWLLAPLVAGGVALALLLVVRPQVSRPPELGRTALRNVSTQVVTSARDLARTARDAARQLRSTTVT